MRHVKRSLISCFCLGGIHWLRILTSRAERFANSFSLSIQSAWSIQIKYHADGWHCFFVAMVVFLPTVVVFLNFPCVFNTNSLEYFDQNIDRIWAAVTFWIATYFQQPEYLLALMDLSRWTSSICWHNQRFPGDKSNQHYAWKF